MLTVSSDKCNFPATMWRAVRVAGIEPAAILHEAGLPATIHLDPSTPLTTNQYFSIWRAIEALTDDCCFAMRIVTAADSTGHQPGFTAGLYAQNFRDAISRLLHLKSMVSSEKIWSQEEGGLWTMGRDWPYATETEPAISIDLTFALVLELGRRGTGRAITPVSVEYTRRWTRCEDLAGYYGCEVKFGSSRNAITFDSADLDIPFPGYCPEFLELIATSLQKAFEDQRASATVSERVKGAMKRAMASGRYEIAVISSELGMSERTLQRRITEEATTYRALLVEARRELCMQLLANPHLDIDHIASMLGYQTTTSFYRAFKEWEDVSPGEWRAHNSVSLSH